MKTIIRIADRPADIPQDWPIHNAPRPLYGQKTWQGDFVHGVFYAAIDPADEYSPGFVRENERNDAYELVYMTREQAMSEALEYYRVNFPKIYPKIEIDDKDHQRMVIEGWIRNHTETAPYYQNHQVTVYNCDFRKVLPSINDGFLIFDPPYNIGFKYDIYQDNLPDEVYIEMLREFGRFSKVVVIQYPEEMQRLVVPALGVPDHCSVWCYNSNTSRRFRLINWYGLTPDYSRIKQPYKNPTDRRVAQLIASGNEGTDLYEWWDDIQIVKNVSPEKTGHPCPVPEALIRRIITLGADPEDVIIDPFAGSLTALKAAQDLGYRAIGMEISESYIKDGLHRLSQFNFSKVALG